MKNRMVFAAVLLGTLTIATHAMAYLSTADRDLLRGLDGFRLAVDRIRPDIERDGLFRSTLQEDMELRLRIGGLKVLSEEEAEKNPDAPCLYLYVDALKCSLGYVYKIRLALMEPVKLVRNHVKVSATVLRIPDGLGITSSLSEIRDAAGDLVDDFVKAWKAVNSKK